MWDLIVSVPAMIIDYLFTLQISLCTLTHIKLHKCAPFVVSGEPTQPDSPISLRCPHKEILGPWLLTESPAKTLISQADRSIRWADKSSCRFCCAMAQTICQSLYMFL